MVQKIYSSKFTKLILSSVYDCVYFSINNDERRYLLYVNSIERGLIKLQEEYKQNVKTYFCMAFKVYKKNFLLKNKDFPVILKTKYTVNNLDSPVFNKEKDIYLLAFSNIDNIFIF